MANEKAEAAVTAVPAPVQNTAKAKQRKLHAILAARMQMVNDAGAMTSKLQDGFDRFNANISQVKE